VKSSKPRLRWKPQKEEIFAEKIHAYTYPRESENTRVKDLVDMYLLLEAGMINKTAKLAINQVFKTRNTHEIPKALPAPPESWLSIFEELAKESDISQTMTDAFHEIGVFYDSLW